MVESRFMPDWLDDLSKLVQVVGFPAVIVALFLGWRQLSGSNRAPLAAAHTARVQTLLGLDERLSAFEDIRQQLNRKSPPEADRIRLRRYMAAFERIGYALEHEQIELRTVDQFYGSRFKSLVDYPKTREIAAENGWKCFHYLWDQLYGYKDNNRGISRSGGSLEQSHSATNFRADRASKRA
jgi:hypothetical protein